MEEIRLNETITALQVLMGTIAVLGLVLVCLIIAQINKLKSKVTLNRYRSKAEGFADLLNWAAIPRDGVVVLKNGGLMAGWLYAGPDETMLTKFDRNFLSSQLNNMFSSLDSGISLHINAIRSPREVYFPKGTSHFSNKVAAAIDQQRRNIFTDKGNLYQSAFVLTLTWLPPTVGTKKMVDKMYVGGNDEKDDLRKTNELLDQFDEKIRNFESSLSVCFKGIVRMKSYKETDTYGNIAVYDQMLSWLNYTLTGEWEKIRLPDTPMYIDGLLAQDFMGGVVPLIGDKYIKVISIEGLGASTSPGMLSFLGELGGSYRWCTRFIALDRNEAGALMKKFRRMWNQKKRGFIAQLFNLKSGTVNKDAVDMVEQADDAAAMINRGLVSFGFVTQNIILMDESLTKVEDQTDVVVKALKSMGLRPRVEGLNCMDAWMGSLPGHCDENIRRPLLSTMNLADIIPVYTPWFGNDHAPCPFDGFKGGPALMYCVTGSAKNSPFCLNLHVGDVGHTLILGPTGSGKSTLLCTLAAQAQRYKGMTVVAFDKGLSMYTLCKACNGQHYVPGGAGALAFCPLGSMKDQDDLTWASDWFESLLKLNNVEVTPQRLKSINETLQTMLESHELDESYPMTISNFIGQVPDLEVKSALDPYKADGPMGSLLDAESDGLDKISSMTVFEIEDLMNLGEKYCLPVLSYLFHRIEKNLVGQPCFLILDEAWIMLGHPVFRAKIREWLKVLRKKNTSVILATQSVSDADKSGIIDVLNESCKSKIYLPNPAALQDSVRKLYHDKLGLNDAQIDVIANGIPKRDYFYANDEKSRDFQLLLDPFQLAFVGVSDPKSLEQVRKLEARDPEHWVDKWLESKQLKWPVDLHESQWKSA